MTRALLPLLLLSALGTSTLAEEPERAQRRGWLGRLLHPFTAPPAPEYQDPRLRGLVLTVSISPQPVKLSEVRQMEVKIRLTNKAKRPITLEFPDTQRFEIFLRDPNEKILTSYTENHAFTEDPGRVMINPDEHIQYDETIATRELTPNKVFLVEVSFPQYPDLRLRHKFRTAP